MTLLSLLTRIVLCTFAMPLFGTMATNLWLSLWIGGDTYIFGSSELDFAGAVISTMIFAYVTQYLFRIRNALKRLQEVKD